MASLSRLSNDDKNKIVLDWLRNNEFYKADNTSDFKTIRECYKAAKVLYESLKFFDTRVTRYKNDLDALKNQRAYSKARSYKYPSDYYSFHFLEVIIEIRFSKRANKYLVFSHKFKPKVFGKLYAFTDFMEDVDTGVGDYVSTPVDTLSEAIQDFHNVVADFLTRRDSVQQRVEDKESVFI